MSPAALKWISIDATVAAVLLKAFALLLSCLAEKIISSNTNVQPQDCDPVYVAVKKQHKKRKLIGLLKRDT